MPLIPGAPAEGIFGASLSADGQTLAGYIGNPLAPGLGFKWTPGSPPILLSSAGSGNATIGGLKFDGSLVAGTIWPITGPPIATTWTGSVATPIPGFPLGTTASLCQGLSAAATTFIGATNFTSYVLRNGTFTFETANMVAISPGGRYVLFGNGGYSLQDLNLNTITPIVAPAGATLVGVSNGGTVVGYNSSGSFFITSGKTTMLPNPLGGKLQAAAISQDGTVIVGINNNGQSFIWTAQWGTRNLSTAVGDQLPGYDSQAFAFLTFMYPETVTVVDGVASIAGFEQTTLPGFPALSAFIATLRTVQPGLPIDLSGTYLAVKNSEVAATTDPNGIVGSSTPGKQVLDPAPSFVSAPFSNEYKPPSSLSGVDLSGHSYWFDVNLGDPASWPNPTSTQNYYAGQAATGQVGAEFEIRASASTSHGIDVSSNNGLRIFFYRKDDRFWAHVTNLWYDEDVNIPAAADATKYHVNVGLATSGALTLTFTQANGRNGILSSDATTVSLAGGSTDLVGLTSASFLIALYNVTDPNASAAYPTGATVSGFATDAIPNAMYVFCDQPYVGSNAFETVAARLNAANLTSPITGYEASLDVTIQNFVLPISSGLTYGEYLNTQIFDNPSPPAFAPDANHNFNHAQEIHTASNATKADLLLEDLAFGEPINSIAGPIYINLLPDYDGGPAKSELFTTSNKPLTTNLFSSNAIMADSSAPGVGSIVAAVGGHALTGSNLILPGQTVSVTVNVQDIGSGLAGNPILTVAPYNIGGLTLPTFSVSLGTVDTQGNFGGCFVVPAGAPKLVLSVSVSDRAGNSSTSSTRTLYTGLSTTVTLTGTKIAAGTTINRVLRVVLGGAGFTSVVINKVVSFNSAGVGTLQLSDADGLPSPANAAAAILYVKDPYHTLGKQTPMSVVNGTYSLGAVTSIALTCGDANNDDVVDIRDLADYATLIGEYATVTASTTAILNFATPLPVGSVNPDFNADNALNDSSFIKAGFGKLGDQDPALAAPGPSMTTLTQTQATALGMPAWIQAAIDVNHDGKLTETEILNWIKTLGS